MRMAAILIKLVKGRIKQNQDVRIVLTLIGLPNGSIDSVMQWNKLLRFVWLRNPILVILHGFLKSFRLAVLFVQNIDMLKK